MTRVALSRTTENRRHEFHDEVERGGRKSMWLFEQMVHNVSSIVETRVMLWNAKAPTVDPELTADDVLTTTTSRHRARWGRKQNGAFKMTLGKFCDPRLRLLQFFFCMRALFSTARRIGVAFDAAVVGKKKRLIGFMTRPDGFGAFLAPQVGGGDLGT